MTRFFSTDASLSSDFSRSITIVRHQTVFILIFLRVRRFVIFMLITMQSQFMLHVVTCFYVEFNMATYYCRCKTSKIASNSGLLLTAGTVLKLPLVACASTDFHRPTKLKIASCAHVLN